MQKEILYRFEEQKTKSISEYQQKDLSIYDFNLTDDDIKQIKKLTGDNLTFNIPQLNINYTNSFNENFDITIQYAPIQIYDLDLLVVDGNDLSWPDMEDQDSAHTIYQYKSDQTKHNLQTRFMDELLMDIGQKIIQTVQPKEHTFSLQQQSINSLINELNYPLKHIPYQVEHFLSQGNNKGYLTNLSGELDITKEVYWDTFNGKLRFNYKGIHLDYSQFQQCFMTDSQGYPSNYIGYFPLPLTYHEAIPPDSDYYTSNYFTLNQDVKTTFSYSYCQSYCDTSQPLTMIKTGTSSNIWVKRLDSSIEHKIFSINNFYYANQLMGLMQNPQRIFTFLEAYGPGDLSKQNIYPQTLNNNYHLQLYMNDNQNKYLKNVCADFYLTPLQESDGFNNWVDTPQRIENPGYDGTAATNYYSNPKYILQWNNPDTGKKWQELSYDRSACLAKEFFLQIWRSVYVITPSLQSNTILYKPENLKYFKYLHYTNTNNANGKDYVVESKEDLPYNFNDKLSLVAWYVNSVSFNNAVSLQSNYPLQYNVEEAFELEQLKEFRVILLDENGCIIPRLSNFSIYLQFQQNMNNQAQQKTTNFNRVITDN